MVDSLRDTFLDPVVRDRVEHVEWRQPDVPAIERFLLEEHSISPNLVKNAVMSIDNGLKR
jgi:hypothetical protein